MNFSVRSSRVTGPKIRVLIGCSLLLFKITHALLSKRMTEPSGRRTPFLVHHYRFQHITFLTYHVELL